MTSDSGLAVIRSAVLVRAKKSQLANLARDLGTGLATLEEFAHGRAKLPNDILRVSYKDTSASINLTFPQPRSINIPGRSNLSFCRYSRLHGR